MNLTAALYSLASAPMFAARPFLAAFVTAMFARFGAHIPLLGTSKVVAALQGAPEWFTSSTALLVMGVLAAAEIASAKSPEIRNVLDELDGFIKAGVALAVTFALVDSDTAKVLKTLDHQSFFSLDTLWSMIVAGTVYGLSLLRRALVAVVSDVDDHDDIGLQSLLSWVENTWTVMGLLFLVIFPIAALVLSALTTLALYLLRKRAERREELTKIPCARCSQRIHPSALACFACGTEVAAPRAIGVFGQPKERLAEDRERHRFELVARKRCPVCATRLRERQVRQACPTCKRVTFASAREFEQYLATLQARLPRTLLICLALSAVPLLGVVPGVVYYRLTLVSGLRGYIPPLRGCTTKWIVRLVNFGIIAVQPIPIAGAVIIPLMCWSNFAIYRRALATRAAADLLPAEAAQPAG